MLSEMRCPGSPGDLLEFQRGTYSHWAVNLGNNEVAHLFGPDFELAALTTGTTDPNIHVRVDSYKDVDQNAKSWKGSKVDGSVVRVNNSEHSNLPSALPPQVIVERALSQVGQPGYHLFYNNCEHFATWCRYGKGFSKQVLEGRFYQPIPNGGTREEVDKHIPRLKSAQRHSWCVVMTDKRWEHPVLGASRGPEEYWTRVEFPWNEMDDKWKEANISFISSSPDYWMVGWRRGDFTQYIKRFQGSPQSVARSVTSWSAKEARAGRSLTKLGCHGGVLVAVAETRKPGEQSTTYHYKGRFNPKYIKEAWAAGQKVLAVVYFNGWWIVQTSTRVKGRQGYIVNNDFPAAEMKKNWDEGFRIQTIAAGPQWVVIMLKTSDSSSMSQSYNTFRNASDAQKFIRRKWDGKMRITAVTGN